MHDLLGLVVHLHLLLGVSILSEHVNLGNHVEGQLIGELLDRGLFTGQHLTVLFVQLRHSGSSCPTGSLITADMNALDVADVLQCLKSHYHHDGGTVGVGNDVAGTVQRILSIALRHHERHILVHTEGTAVVNHHRTMLGNGLCIFLGRTATCTGKGDIHSLEIIIVLKQLHFNFLATERVLLPRATLAAEKQQFIDGKISLVEHTQELLSYGSACTYNCNSHKSLIILITYKCAAKVRQIY